MSLEIVPMAIIQDKPNQHQFIFMSVMLLITIAFKGPIWVSNMSHKAKWLTNSSRHCTSFWFFIAESNNNTFFSLCLNNKLRFKSRLFHIWNLWSYELLCWVINLQLWVPMDPFDQKQREECYSFQFWQSCIFVYWQWIQHRQLLLS